MDGERRLARCECIGGVREPPNFVLPAWINPDNSIVIDFSVPPKNGPKDFLGHWDSDGIKFAKDGNKWPMVPKIRKDNFLNLLTHFDSFEEDSQEVSKGEFFQLFHEMSLSFADEAVFIRYLELSWGVGENEQDLDFKCKVSSLIYRLREMLVEALDGEINDYAKQN